MFGKDRVHCKYGKATVVELLRCIEEYRLGGLKLHPDTGGCKSNDFDLAGPTLEILGRHRMVFFHAGYFPTGQPAVFVPLASSFPAFPIILAHAGVCPNPGESDAFVQCRRRKP